MIDAMQHADGVNAAVVLRELLEDATRVHVDARVIGYHLLADARYLELTRLLFTGLRSGKIRAQTSAVTLYQLLAELHRHGEPERAREIGKILTIHPGLELLPVTAEVAEQAAQVRAQLGGRTERALQIATALIAGADLYLTEHSGLRRIVGMSVANLESFADGVASHQP
jgi:predicted nucleic acid-binding protein